MRLLLVGDAFPPVRTSAAALMYDLAVTLGRFGHDCTVVTPDAQLRSKFVQDRGEGFDVLRVRTGRIKHTGHVRRAINEMLLSKTLWAAYRDSPACRNTWDGIIFYSPTIFLGPLIGKLKSTYKCPAYLVLRDIFPDALVDLGVMRRGPHYWLFKAFAKYQFEMADVIGVESAANRRYFTGTSHRLEVLYNWVDLAERPVEPYDIPKGLRNKRVLVYCGNMGIQQDMDNVVRLAERLLDEKDTVILLVGDGSERRRLESEAVSRRLTNVMFHPEIPREKLRGLLRHCHAGLISLDKRLKSHNIPGKLLSYLEAGLPVLASVNEGNDLKEELEKSAAGIVCWNGDDDALAQAARRILSSQLERERMAKAAQLLCIRKFSSEAATKQIVSSLLSLADGSYELQVT